MNKTAIIIPSHLAAKRLPNKPLLKINNKQTYNQHCDDVHKWSKEFYQNFNEDIFGAFLFDCINNYKHDTEEKSNQYK